MPTKSVLLKAASSCAHCGLSARLKHASYIDSWLDALHHDKRLIFFAAGAAQKAVDFVMIKSHVHSEIAATNQLQIQEHKILKMAAFLQQFDLYGAACRIRTDDLPLTSLRNYVFSCVDCHS
ncbi:MAG: zincin-like metallopeptidase domain-containing protein [Candidatus Nitrotoga sp.]